MDFVKNLVCFPGSERASEIRRSPGLIGDGVPCAKAFVWAARNTKDPTPTQWSEFDSLLCNKVVLPVGYFRGRAGKGPGIPNLGRSPRKLAAIDSRPPGGDKSQQWLSWTSKETGSFPKSKG